MSDISAYVQLDFDDYLKFMYLSWGLKDRGLSLTTA